MYQALGGMAEQVSY